MSDAVLRKFHGVKVWRSDPFSTLNSIELQATYDEGDAFQYMVFNFPYIHLRSGATSFCDVKQNGKSLAFKDTFLLFLALIRRTCISGVDTQNAKVVCFLETVQYNNVSVGVRVWFFSNRQQTPVQLNLVNLIVDNAKTYEKMKAKNPKIQVKLATAEGHIKCKSLHDYTEFVSNYANNESFLLSQEDIHKDIVNAECEVGPLNVFSVDSNGFCYNFGSRQNNEFPQNVRENYVNGNTFSFPNEKLVLRVSPEQITIEELFIKKKYLPSYFFEKVRLPSVKVTEVDMLTRRIKVPNHIHLMKKIDGVCLKDIIHEYSQENDGNADLNNVFTFTYDYQSYKIRVEPALRRAFVLTFVSPTASDVPEYAIEGVRKFFKYQPKYLPKQELSDQWFTDVLTDMKKNPDTKHLLADKSSLDTLDMLKYKCSLLEVYNRDRRRAFQEEMMEEFMQQVVKDVNANISEPMQCIIHWLNNRYDHRMIHTRKKTDANGSIFLNSIIWKLNFFDEDVQVSTGHQTLMLLNHTKLDAYRQELDLHINLIFTGEGATSKSFLFEKMKQCSIKGTVEELTYQTKRSNAVEIDQNDCITVFNEAPAGLFMSNNGKDGDKEAEDAFKEKLTSQITRCKTWMEDPETGQRTNRTTISQSIGVYCGATNNDPSMASQAMTTRFYWGEFESVELKSKSIDMCMQGEKDWALLGRDTLKKSLHFFHLEHARVALVFKLMFVGILKYPSLDVSDFIYSQLRKSLQGQKISTSTRFKERYDKLCYIFTICNALDTVYNYEGGLHANKPFDARTLLDIEPYLWCTEEISIFVFTLISAEIYNPSEVKIIKAIWKIFTSSGGNAFRTYTSETGSQLIDLSYIRVNKSGKKLYTAIQQAIPNHEGRPSEFNIKAVIKKWKTKSYSNYEMVDATLLHMNDREYNDRQPEKDPQSNTVTQKDGCLEDGNSTHFNIMLFHKVRKDIDIDPIETAIDNCRHAYTIEKKVICGCPNRKNAVVQYPSVFKCITMKAKNDKILQRKNPLYKNKTSLNIRRTEGMQVLEDEKIKGSILKNDFDRWGCMQHSKKLSIPSDKMMDFFRKYNHELTEQFMACHEPQHQINYPDDVINGYKERDQIRADQYVSTYENYDLDKIIEEERRKRMRVTIYE